MPKLSNDAVFRGGGGAETLTGQGIETTKSLTEHSQEEITSRKTVTDLTSSKKQERVGLNDGKIPKRVRDDVYINNAKQEVQKDVTDLTSHRLNVLSSSRKAAFTLAEGAKPHSLSVGYRKTAFTLAEVLITLGIIGVVAAVILPTLMQNIQDRVRAKRIENIEQKLSKATDKMLAVSGMSNYGSTMNFVNELKNHLSIVKVCSNGELRGCWPYSKVKLNDGTEWDISETKTRRTLQLGKGAIDDWDDTVGIVTADGTSMILSYNKACNIDQTKSPVWSDSRSTSSDCLAAVYDWNGGKKPNSLANIDSNKTGDVITYNANGLGTLCTTEVGDFCFGKYFVPQPVSYSECLDLKEKGIVKQCDPKVDADRFAGAAKKCGGVDNMPTGDELKLLYDKIKESSASSEQWKVNKELAGIPRNVNRIYSNEEFTPYGSTAKRVNCRYLSYDYYANSVCTRGVNEYFQGAICKYQ